MGTLTETRRWDLSHVRSFAHSFASNIDQEPPSSSQKADDLTVNTDTASRDVSQFRSTTQTRDFASGSPSKLGDFSRIWQFLGTPAFIVNAAAPGSEDPSRPVPSKDDYASDGATYVSNKSKQKTQSNNAQLSDGTDGEASAAEPSHPLAGLTKTQRKKARRKQRKALQNHMSSMNVVSESEADTITKMTPAHKASAHVIQNTPTPTTRYGLRSQTAPSKTVAPSKPETLDCVGQPVMAVISKQNGSSKPVWPNSQKHGGFSREQPKEKGSRPGDCQSITTSQAVNAVAQAMASIKQDRMPTSPLPNTSKPRTKSDASTKQWDDKTTQNGTHADRLAAWKARSNGQSSHASSPASQTATQKQAVKDGNSTGSKSALPFTPQNNKTISLVPSSIQPITNGKSTTAARHLVPKVAGTPATAPPTMPAAMRNFEPYVENPTSIEPKIVRSREDSHWALFMKILENFYHDRKYLVNPANLTTHNNDPKGIHVFVDASNIFIGFMDQLKRARNIHPMARVPQANLSFDALALLMERRRPVAKRVLAGSTPHIPAFDTAKKVGYECSILEKVYKARELTERQIYFKELDAARYSVRKGMKVPLPSNQVAPAAGPPATAGTLSASPPKHFIVPRYGGGSGVGGSETDTKTPQYAPAAHVEQGVDEILHLKILESIVDYEDPSIIVLATGDAASAEYSLGFMAMVERALRKGWTVEIVSWSKNINGSYKKKAWVEHWGEKFQIIYLDDYAEELLDI